MSEQSLTFSSAGSCDLSAEQCEKCGAPINGQDALVCRQCGWYASIGTFVEIDRSWESVSDPELAIDEETVQDERAEIPAWAWTLLTCLAIVVVESVAVRVLTLEEGTLRTRWSLTQLFVGAVAFAVAHGYGFVQVMREESDTSLLDALLMPFKPWGPIFRVLPERQWICHLGLSGLMAAMMSLLVIGAIPYDRLLDWGIQEAPEQNLLGAISALGKNANGNGDESLGEAIEAFAGTQNLSEANGGGKKKKPKAPPVARKKKDCVVVGFRANDEGLPYSLYLAAANLHGNLQYVGNVTPRLPIDELQELGAQLATYRTSRPLVKVQAEEVIWVKPRLICRVSYLRQGKQGGLIQAEIEDLLGEAKLGTAE